MKVVPLYPSSRNERSSAHSGARVIAALDVGSSKICCMIGEVRGLRRRSGEAVPAPRITGVGVQAARGVRGGVVVDVDAAERAVRLAVDAAERMAGVTVEEVHLNMSGGRPKCETLRASIEVDGGQVAERHIELAMGRALSGFSGGRREVVHVTPVQFSLDGAPGVDAPEGMYADHLTADVNVVSIERGPLHNLELVIERCMLRPAGFIVAPCAAARAVLVDDETTLGVTLIEMGAETTSVAVFARGRLEHAEIIPIGSNHITADIAAGLSTTLEAAERLKTLHGSTLPSLYDDHEVLTLPMLGEEGPAAAQQAPRSLLVGIIRPRVEEILEMARDAIEACPAARRAGRRAVLSGGGSQLVGMREMAERILNRHVRIGAPRQLAGLPPAMATPAFAVVAGLLRSALQPDRQSFLLADAAHEPARTGTGGYFTRVREWLHQSF